MREIKSRGYNLERKEWVYGTYLDGYIVYNNVLEYNDYLAIDVYAEVVEESVGEYTGEKDVNGREIYEGDELKNAEGVTYKVMYEDGSFVLYNDDYIVTTPRISKGKINRDGLEIIGNIYENKELLD